MSSITMEQQPQALQRKANVAFTKKKYYELVQQSAKYIPDELSQKEFAEKIKEILNFDPCISTYQAHNVKAYRERKKQEGVSTYITSGRKTQYYTSKQALKTT